MRTTAERRALIVKLGAIGDVVMAVPGAHALHEQGFIVDWVCSRAVAPVLQLYPWIHAIEADERALLSGSAAGRLRAMSALWRQLAGRRYDLCATLYYDSRYRWLSSPVRAKRRIMLSREHRRYSLLPGRHHTDEYARILLERRDDEVPVQLAPVPVIGLPQPCCERTRKPRVVIVPGGARNALRDDALRRWPLENYVAVAAALIENGVDVVLAGGPEDGWVEKAFSRLKIRSEVGRRSLVETLALFDSADVTVTHDTGPLHLAGITGTAIVAIFGPTDPHGRLPQRENCVAMWGGEGFACRPCYDGRDYAPCRHNGCMEQVSTAMVLEQVQRLLGMKRVGAALLPEVIVPEHTPIVRLESKG